MALREGVEAQIQAKGNNIVEATIKIVNNGSYSFTLEGGTVLNITVYVAPCAQCQQIAHTVPQQQSKTDHDVSLGSATSGECAHTVQSFHHESTSPITIEQDDTPIPRGFEESEEADPEKSQLVCSDSYVSKPQKFSKKKKKK